MAAAEPMPLILDNASLQISTDGTTANLVELACLANHLEIAPDVATTTLDTFCGSRDYPGNVQWRLVATLYQSFDPDATEEVLSAAVEGGVPVAFMAYGYRDRPISPTNPAWTGFVIPQPYAPISGDAGDASTVELEWSMTGPPTKIVAPPTGLDASSLRTHAELDAAAAERGITFPEGATVAEKQTILSGEAEPVAA